MYISCIYYKKPKRKVQILDNPLSLMSRMWCASSWCLEYYHIVVAIHPLFIILLTRDELYNPEDQSAKLVYD